MRGDANKDSRPEVSATYVLVTRLDRLDVSVFVSVFSTRVADVRHVRRAGAGGFFLLFTRFAEFAPPRCSASLNAAAAALCFASTTTPDVLASSLCVTRSVPGSIPSARSTHPGTHSHPLLSCACVGRRAGLFTTNKSASS